MVRDDIIAGLKNAVERGYSLQQAKQSFLNAGYSLRDVEEASQFVGGVIRAISSEKTNQPFSEAIPTTVISTPAMSAVIQQPLNSTKKEAGAGMIIFLIIILILLLAVLAGVFFYREKITEYLQNLMV